MAEQNRTIDLLGQKPAPYQLSYTEIVENVGSLGHIVSINVILRTACSFGNFGRDPYYIASTIFARVLVQITLSVNNDDASTLPSRLGLLQDRPRTSGVPSATPHEPPWCSVDPEVVGEEH